MLFAAISGGLQRHATQGMLGIAGSAGRSSAKPSVSDRHSVRRMIPYFGTDSGGAPLRAGGSEGQVGGFARRAFREYTVIAAPTCVAICWMDHLGTMGMLSDDEIRNVLQRARTIAVVGLSDRPERPSHAVARYLQRAGYRVIPVNPNLRSAVLGEQPYASLRAIAGHVDIVDIFRRPEFVPEVVEDAIAIGADVVWMQFGATNPAAAQRASAAGLGVVMDRCLAIEHRRLQRVALRNQG